MRTLQHLVGACSLAIAGLALGISPAWSAEYFLKAEAFTMTLQGGTTIVPMWGYNKCTDSTYNTCDGPSVPGPQLVVPAGDTSGLTIHLRNSLPNTVQAVPDMTSIVIPGQREDNMAPEMFPPVASPHGDGVQRRRMRSFTHETNRNQVKDYLWSDLKPGTYLYHSGTHAQVQVQMGLYGSVKADAAAGEAYAGQAYASEAMLLFSEIDPALHAEVENGTYGTPNHPTSTINYQPKYFLINGAPYQVGPPETLTQTPPINVNGSQAGQRVLLRLLNAGLESHVATLLGGHFQVIAEDGNVLAHGRDQYETLLPAGKTMDAIWMPAANGIYSIYDRRNRQGMLAKLEIGGIAGAPTALSDVYSMLVTAPSLTVPAKGVLANDQNPVPGSLTAVPVTSPASGTLTLNSDGSFTYTPNPGFSGQDSFTYKANNGTTDSNVATVIILVNNPPVANPDTATTRRNMPVTVNVLANDSDPENQALTIISVTQGTYGTVTTNGSTVTYTPTTANGQTGDSFTYTISDGQGLTPGTKTGTVTVTFNDPPTANPDNRTVAEDGSITFNPRMNDSDPDGDALTIIAVTQGTKGTVTINNGQSVTYTPAPNLNGTDTFTYTISDGQTPIPGTATGTVTMTISPVNDSPVAMADAYQVAEDGSITFNPRLNDSDPDGQALTISAVTQPANGTVTINGGLTLTYVPALNFNGIRTFTYTISDGQNPPGTATATVTMTVTPVNDRPVAVADAYAVNKQTLFTVPAPGVLLNDNDVDGNALTAIQVTNLSNTVILDATGSFTYTTGAGYVGTRVFSYRVNDGLLNSTVVNVTLTKALTVSSIVSNNNNGNPIWIIRGRSTTPNSTVTVYPDGTLGGTPLGNATVDGTGAWRLDVPRQGANVSLAPFISVRSSTGAELIEVPAP